MAFVKRLAAFLRHFLRFGFAGGVVVSVHAGGYLLLVHLGWAGPLLANAIAFLVGTLIAFAVHYTWTFRSARSPRRAAWRFGVAKLIGLALNTGAVYLITKELHLSHYWALPVMMLVTPLIVFTISKYWAFRDIHHYESMPRKT